MPITDYRDILSHYSDFNGPRDTRADYAQGELDGRANRPPAHQEDFGGYEWDVINQARADLARFSLNLQIDRRLSVATNVSRKHQRYEEVDSLIRDASRRHDSAIGAINKDLGSNSPRAKREDFEAQETERAYDDIQRLINREPRMMFDKPLWWNCLTPYILFMGFFAPVELVINKGAFRDLFGAGSLGTYGGALMMGALVVLLAHFLGTFIRQAAIRRTTSERLRVWIGIPLIIIIVMSSLLALAGRRTSIGDFPDDMTLLGYQAGLVLPFLMNVAIFITGTLLSIFRHDPHPDVETLLRSRDQAQEKVEKRRAEYEQRVNEVEEEYRRRRANLTARADRLQREIDDEEAQEDLLPAREAEEMNKVIAVVSQRLLAYQSGNERRRVDPRPQYFGEQTIRMAEAYLRGTRTRANVSY
jgi:uncharacterized membrane protein